MIILYPQLRLDFFDNLLNIFFIKLFFTSFCILVLINGTNFIDGVNTLVVGYFILVASNVLYLTEVNNLELDILLVSTCLTCFDPLYIYLIFLEKYI